ncbi:hypothetical protein [Shewanella sp. Isolate8]|uniref:hypothetical protein n=1 Tax=Shewanella sp. Isolate8 TaxID=2908529 RepID=UPI001EFE14A3|nr:hypothetical protein [Shewanella sp. Isolate8]MCG9746132.1 hypothetical protein [Shewanella sp. Isolate8]
MFEPLLTQPQFIELTQRCQLHLRLRESVSDFSLLQTMGGHLLECVVTQASSDNGLILRLHPYLICELAPIEVPTIDAEGSQTEVLHRSHGQGGRLFSALGISPVMCAERLRKGLVIDLEVQGSTVSFTPQFDQKWLLVTLERDLRLFGGPLELRRAKAVLARAEDLSQNAEALLLEIGEIELVRQELAHFANHGDVKQHGLILSEVTKVDEQLLRKKQLLSHHYYQKVQRPNWQHAANQHEDLEALQRKLESYQLLAPPELNLMVEQMFLDD